MAHPTVGLTGATRLYPIIGDPIEHVQSPHWLTRTLGDLGSSAVCVPLLVAAEDLDAVMAGLAAATNVDGLLVTMPHKSAALAYCASASERARLLRAVSVIRRNVDGTWHGEMLDGLAFVAAQRSRGATIAGSRALLVGTGGAGGAIAHALLEADVVELVINDRDDRRAHELVSLLEPVTGHQVSTGPPDPTAFDLVFNATPVGLESETSSPIDVDLLSKEMFVGDVIAADHTSALIGAARRLGCGTSDGHDMVASVQELMAEFLLHPGR